MSGIDFYVARMMTEGRLLFVGMYSRPGVKHTGYPRCQWERVRRHRHGTVEYAMPGMEGKLRSSVELNRADQASAARPFSYGKVEPPD